MARRPHHLKIGVSGIRGVVGDFLTPALMASFAQAFATYVGAGRILIGRDTRSSGAMFAHAVICGVTASGCDVLDLGVCPTPTIQCYVPESKARGGIAITASHNPAEYNALKLFNAEGLFLNRYELEELLDIYHQGYFRHADNPRIGRLREEQASAGRVHLDRVLSLIDVDAIRGRRFRVVLDSVNGAGSVMSPEFLRDDLGCELFAIYINPAKPFPRPAEPRPEHLTELAALTRDNRCDIGFAQDPDGDRLAVADETGKVLDNNDTLALVVDAVLSRTPGPVAVNLSTSSAIDDIAARYDCPVYRTPVGEANVVERMEASGAVIGGEGSSAGMIFPAVHMCRDSYAAMGFYLDLLARTGLKLSELVEQLPAYHRMSHSLVFRHGALGPAVQTLEARYPEARVDRSDGFKIILPDAWLHLRPSNTEPLLRISAEARDPGVLERLMGEAERLLAGEAME